MIQRTVKAGVWIIAILILIACEGGMPLQMPGGPDQPSSNQPGQAGPTGGPVGASGVRGKVSDAAGNPLSEVFVTAQSTDTPPQQVPEIAIYTDQQGQYQWTLPPGGYSLTFTHQDYAPANQSVTIQPGQSSTLDIALTKQ